MRIDTKRENAYCGSKFSPVDLLKLDLDGVRKLIDEIWLMKDTLANVLHMAATDMLKTINLTEPCF